MRKGGGRIPFVPSPIDIVRKMLSLADPRPDELLIDLGSGDGRIIVAAAEDYRCRAIGVELDKELYERSMNIIHGRLLSDRARIIRGNLYEFNLSGADVITLYLLPETLKTLKPRLLSLKRGSRIVCHDFPIPGLEPSEIITTRSFFTGRPHKIYLYEIS
ncbi:MAG: class I SAM-dependent methyltransferase [Aigarchaeota archaeon]|nr:class I SAM-dependent methyltransferase [Candidatus Wolframiiraptor gerlachensis]